MTSPLSSTSATLLSCALGTVYVAPLYLWAPAKTGKRRDRNHPSVIKARLIAITFSSLVDCAVVYVIASGSLPDAGNSLRETLSLLGFQWPENAWSCLLAPLIYSGTLLSGAMAHSLPNYTSFLSWVGIRNFIVAPITEEIVFRSCCLAAAHLAGRSLTHMVWVTPVYFGIAHLHHGWETYKSLGKTQKALQRAVLSTLMQFTYTTLFGAYASFLAVRTRSIIPAITSHIFCNLIGLPSIPSEAKLHPDRKNWFYAAHLAGIVGFGALLYPWTRSSPA